MENISNVLFWISNGLLVPVIVGLLYFFIRALFLLGGVYGEYLERKKTERDLNEKLENMAEEEVYGFRTDLGKMQPTPFVFTARKLLADGMTSIHRDRLIGGYEIQESTRLNMAKNLTKFGPILGLMGTLIPMGPALVGLSTGDVASMAYNMQVACATTVSRLFSGGIGYILLQVKQRWIDRDLLNLDFLAGLAGRLEEQAGKEEIR